MPAEAWLAIMPDTICNLQFYNKLFSTYCLCIVKKVQVSQNYGMVCMVTIAFKSNRCINASLKICHAKMQDIEVGSLRYLTDKLMSCSVGDLPIFTEKTFK